VIMLETIYNEHIKIMPQTLSKGDRD